MMPTCCGSRSRTIPDDHPAAALWWRILDQRPETPNNTRPPRGSPSDPAHDHQVTRPAATQATLGAATRVRSEPLKTSTQTMPAKCFTEPIAEPFY
jgi:hypothetical protein